MRITGPYRHRAGYRYRVTEAAGAPRWAPSGRTEGEARELAEGYAEGLKARGSLTVAGVAARYLAHLQSQGNKPGSIQSAAHQLARLDLANLQFASVTPLRAKAAYHQAAGRYAVATQHLTLRRYRALWTWAIEEGLTRANPWSTVRVLGRAKRGKPQLTRSELARFIHTCQELAGQGDEGALAALIAVCMGLRASEILSRTVRDIDVEPDPETGEAVPVLRVSDNLERAFRLKTDSSGRSPQIPPIVEPLLAKVAAGKAPGDPLFPGTLGGRRTRQWLWDRVKDLCVRAGVPTVCPHALRGSLATSAAATGVRIDLISAVLGHSNSSITRQHYIVPGTVERAQLQRGMQTLTRPPSSLPT